MNPSDSPASIGFFDSGVGGVSVWREVRRRLPDCATLYVADNAHCPYGPRSPEQVRCFSYGIARFLLERGARLVVVACNTASAAALHWLRAKFSVPFVGMEPAVKPAAQQTRTGHIGVLATLGTVNGHLFRATSARYANAVQLHIQVGDGLAERVEAGQAEAPETEQLLRHYLQPMFDAGVDEIVLGSTHYSFLVPVIRRIVPTGVSVIDPAIAVARQVERITAERGIISLPPRPDLECDRLAAGCQSAVGGKGQEESTARFFATGTPDVLSALLRAETGQSPWVERLAWKGRRLVVRDS
jgi:glutamate racemase